MLVDFDRRDPPAKFAWDLKSGNGNSGQKGKTLRFWIRRLGTFVKKLFFIGKRNNITFLPQIGN